MATLEGAHAPHTPRSRAALSPRAWDAAPSPESARVLTAALCGLHALSVGLMCRGLPASAHAAAQLRFACVLGAGLGAAHLLTWFGALTASVSARRALVPAATALYLGGTAVLSKTAADYGALRDGLYLALVLAARAMPLPLFAYGLLGAGAAACLFAGALLAGTIAGFAQLMVEMSLVVLCALTCATYGRRRKS